MNLRRYIFLAAAFFALAACETDKPTPPEPPGPRPEKAPQTLLIYLCGRGNLVGGFDKNIQNALKAIDRNILGYSRVLVFRQLGTSTSTISELRYDDASGKAVQEVLKEYTTQMTSTEEATMTRILNDMIALAPAEEYGLVMGSHATGWVPSSISSLQAMQQKQADNYWKKIEGGPETRHFGYDNGRTMNITTLASGVEATGINFSYLIFDACFMSSVEALYDLRETADYIIASPCEVMMYGFPYDLTLPCLFRNNGRDHDLQAACESFYTFYSTTTATEQSGCIAMANCSEMEDLAEVMRRINSGKTRTYDSNTIQIYEGLSPHLFFDLKDFVNAKCDDNALRDEFNAQFDKTFPAVCRLHTPTFYTAYGGQTIEITSFSGVTISEPSPKYTAENENTNWYLDTH